MEKQIYLTYNGQALLQQDVNDLGEAGALADDRVFAELFRMAPYDGSSPSRGILPSGYDNSGLMPLVKPNGATGTVLVNPFRAFIGSRTAVGTSALKNWRDIRSTVSVDTTTLAQAVTIAANSSGNPRWDLIYAVVTPDATGPGFTRKVKDPSTAAITGAVISTSKSTTCTLAVEQGTPGASPNWPSVPSDSGGHYNIPLAYVRVPDGFSSGSTVLPDDIGETAALLRLNVAGTSGPEPANCHYTAGSSCLSTAKIQSWGATGTKPAVFLPSTMSGGASLLVYVDLTTGSESHASGSVIDSRDWRGRLVKWTLVDGTIPGGGSDPAWVSNTSTNVPLGFDTLDAFTRSATSGLSHTIIPGTNFLTAIGSELQNMADGTTFTLGIDASTGNIKMAYTGAPDCQLFAWLEFSGRLDNDIYNT